MGSYKWMIEGRMKKNSTITSEDNNINNSKISTEDEKISNVRTSK